MYDSYSIMQIGYYKMEKYIEELHILAENELLRNYGVGQGSQNNYSLQVSKEKKFSDDDAKYCLLCLKRNYIIPISNEQPHLYRINSSFITRNFQIINTRSRVNLIAALNTEGILVSGMIYKLIEYSKISIEDLDLECGTVEAGKKEYPFDLMIYKNNFEYFAIEAKSSEKISEKFIKTINYLSKNQISWEEICDKKDMCNAHKKLQGLKMGTSEYFSVFSVNNFNKIFRVIRNNNNYPNLIEIKNQSFEDILRK